MSNVVILCVEDEAEVRDAIIRDLEPFQQHFRIECVEDVNEAREVVADLQKEGDVLGLILCDHVLPGTTGVDFMVEMNHNPLYSSLRKVLLTGQAGHEDTIKAINEGHVNHYVAKPWRAADLQAVVRNELTEFVIETSDDLMPYVAILDSAKLLDAISQRGADT